MAASASLFVAALQQGEEPEQLEVQPDDRDHQAEPGVPLEVLGEPGLRAPLDEVEVEGEVEGGEAGDEEAEPDAEEVGLTQERDFCPEQGKHE